jgi:NAD(P)-dependent dehydrogenase (short-subunit alcohol dehydrogenase family)
MHLDGRSKLESFKTDVGRITYSDSKLHALTLCMAVARKWPQVYANAVDPGWVPTKMGGKAAPDDLRKGYETQVWLAASNEKPAKVSGRYFHHQKESPITVKLMSGAGGISSVAKRLRAFPLNEIYCRIGSGTMRRRL